MPKGDRDILKADVEDGYGKVANLLFEALAYSKLNGKQVSICLFIIRRTYCWNKKEDEISLRDFATACDTSESYISKQLKQLIEWNVISRTNYQPGKVPTYSINTRVAQWYKGCINVQGLNECIKQGLYNCARVDQPETLEAVSEESSGKKVLKKDIKKDIEDTNVSSPDGAAEMPTSQELIVELTENYRKIPGVTGTKGDYAFIGALYNEYGYGQVLVGLNRLQMAMAVQEIDKPLVYLKGILNNNTRGPTRSQSMPRAFASLQEYAKEDNHDQKRGVNPVGLGRS